ncbi:MAG: hypothetical protein F6K30_06650 [Cyanothece sp. SIO2G6]|nr:hypothetical protein [Cyanothece sp. SIO2G6]
MNITSTTTGIPMTWDDYRFKQFNRADIPWNNFRWVRGEVIEVAREGFRNKRIQKRLSDLFEQQIKVSSKDWECYADGLGVEVRLSVHQERVPDLIVITRECSEMIDDELDVITLNMPDPVLVVEVVSPSSVKTDLEEKELEYLDRGVGEYISIDWRSQSVVVRTRKDGKSYTYNQYGPGERVVVESFPTLVMTVDELISR